MNKIWVISAWDQWGVDHILIGTSEAELTPDQLKSLTPKDGIFKDMNQLSTFELGDIE